MEGSLVGDPLSSLASLSLHVVAVVFDVRRQQFQDAVPMVADRHRVELDRKPFAALAPPGVADRRPFLPAGAGLRAYDEFGLARVVSRLLPRRASFRDGHRDLLCWCPS